MLTKVNLGAKLSRFSEHWRPKVVAELNGQEVKLAKFQGEFVWHRHDEADELFLVLRGRFRMELRDGAVDMEEGDVIVIPRGVEHRPVADEETSVLLFEPVGMRNTGNVSSDHYTAPDGVRI